MTHTVRTVRTLRAVAMAVGLALLLWSTGLPTLFRSAEAASITSASDTMSNSAPSQASNHTIAFTTQNGLAIGQTIQIAFPAQFTIGTMNVQDVDIDINGVPSSTASSSASGVWGVAFAGQNITFTSPTNIGVASATPIVIRIGTNAITGGTGTHQITNPSATTTSYTIDVGGTMQDSGQLRVAIVDQVQVTASVDTSLTFSVSGVVNGQTVNGSPTTTAATTTSTSLPFGTLPVNSSRVLAQDLSVTTNATNGYTVTVQDTGDLQSSTGAKIYGYVDGSYTETPTSWQGPAADVNNSLTYGHWGLTSDDGTTTRAQQFSSDKWVSPSTTPVIVMGNTGPSDGTTQGIGLARIGYQVQISALQAAGSDYSTTLRYVVTPTF